MTDVFISYSRKDIAFARLLHEALIENGLETWIDWQIANRDLTLWGGELIRETASSRKPACTTSSSLNHFNLETSPG